MRISLPSNESCTDLDDDIVIYSCPFGIKLPDLLLADNIPMSPLRYQLSFASIEHSWSTPCYFAFGAKKSENSADLLDGITKAISKKSGRVALSLVKS